MLIVPYKESWQSDFNKIKEVILNQLEPLNLKVEHVGSTSVVGMSAKAIIDIDMCYTNTTDFEEIRLGLESLGYYHNGDQGITDREVFKRIKKSEHTILDSIPHHLYVCHESSLELRRHLLFKEHLQVNKVARNEYEEIKLKLASQANQDKKVYALLKEEVAADFINACIRTQEIENGK